LLFALRRINVPWMASDKSVFDVYREKLEDHEMMMGPVQGKLAVLLDLLTDSMIVAGKHSIYCRGKRSAEASPDMETITEGLLQSKELVQAIMDHFRKQN
jgi:hypothetical protein